MPEKAFDSSKSLPNAGPSAEDFGQIIEPQRRADKYSYLIRAEL
jgi:hypothetical protein